jgi:glycogen synthase
LVLWIIQKEFESISEIFKSHADARLILKYDDVYSHLIYAASDMFIIPSIFEPCGLTQVTPLLEFTQVTTIFLKILTTNFI